MNLLLLVEGKRTEPKVYKAWLTHLFPNLDFVFRPEDLSTFSCRIVPGNGYPNMVSAPKSYTGVSRLEACLLDIKNYDNIDYFLICVDSEECDYGDRLEEVRKKLQEAIVRVGLDGKYVKKIFIIVQHCCLETWALGNHEIPLIHTPVMSLDVFSELQRHYDVINSDPELLCIWPQEFSYSNRAKFHEYYLKRYLESYGFSYTKKNPKVIGEKWYLEALIRRCDSTDHLRSLNYLFSVLKDIQASSRK
ncbi:hypothetical protein [Leptolyngbya sp. KIOST-1]|uniref:hypothetical protein n=1 Tax=Leptolyngbya sp. KIOST-1 TaxID=1229172 RepID=UPI0012E0B5C8|nr:hypothetical protein [Leptolyngbya sp. KIOST-1]